MHYNLLDNIIINTDRVIHTLFSASPVSGRDNPAQVIDSETLTAKEKNHAAGLMRVNHAGEVCAQALYQGQALTAQKIAVQESMQQAAKEEYDHLAWCEQRLQALHSHTSYLNPLWYVGALSMGTFAGLIGDKWSLGFVAETERQVVRHLESHLAQLPVSDYKSRAIVEQMKVDEAKHATHAVVAGAAELPMFIKRLMAITSTVMTSIAYYI